MFKFLIASTIITVASSSTLYHSAPSSLSEFISDPVRLARAEHFSELAEVLEQGKRLPFVHEMKDFTWMAINDDRIVNNIYDTAVRLSVAFNRKQGIVGTDIHPQFICLAAVSSFSTILGPDQDVDDVFGSFAVIDSWLMIDAEDRDSWRILKGIMFEVNELIDEHGHFLTIPHVMQSRLYETLSFWAEQRVRDEAEIAREAKWERKAAVSAAAAKKASQPTVLSIPAIPDALSHVSSLATSLAGTVELVAKCAKQSAKDQIEVNLRKNQSLEMLPTIKSGSRALIYAGLIASGITNPTISPVMLALCRRLFGSARITEEQFSTFMGTFVIEARNFIDAKDSRVKPSELALTKFIKILVELESRRSTLERLANEGI